MADVSGAAVVHAAAEAVCKTEGITRSDLMGWLAPKVDAPIGVAPATWSERQLDRAQQLLGKRLRKSSPDDSLSSEKES